MILLYVLFAKLNVLLLYSRILLISFALKLQKLL